MKPAGGTSTRGAPMPAIALGDVAHPGAAGDVVIEPGVAIDEDVDACAVLGGDVAGETIKMLLAIGEARKALRRAELPRRFSVYQLGRGNAPVVVVSRALFFVVVNTRHFSRFHQWKGALYPFRC